MADKNVKLPKKGLFTNIGERLDEFIKRVKNRKSNQGPELYNEHLKTLDLKQLLPEEALKNAFKQITSGSIQGSKIASAYFDVQLGRFERYKEYEDIYYRIPEAAEALHIYVDHILSPNLGPSMNTLEIFETNNTFGPTAKKFADFIIDKTDFIDLMPSIVFTTCLYGDCFLELIKHKTGVSFNVYDPKNISLIYDQRTGIEAGILVFLNNDKTNNHNGQPNYGNKSKLAELISKVYPIINMNLSNNMVNTILSDKRKSTFADNTTKYEEIKQLLRDLLANEDIDFKYLPPSQYTKFSIFYNNMYYPYGTGLFDPTRSIAKQLLLVEAALASYRATRTPIRNKYLVEVGSTIEAEIPSLVTNVKDRIKREKVLDGELNGFDSIPNFLGIEEDMWIPVINGVPTLNIEQLPVPTLDPYINDADYFKKKVLGSLGIPPSYLAEENTTSTRALLTLEDIRFARTIKKYQKDLNVGLNDMINNSFVLLNQSQLVKQVKIALPEPTGIESKLRMDELNSQVDAAQKFISLFPKVPKTYILNNLMGMNDDDLEEMKSYIEKDKRYKDIIGPSEEKGEDEFGAGLGGLDGMDFDMGEEELPEAFSEVNEEGNIGEETVPTPELDLSEETG